MCANMIFIWSGSKIAAHHPFAGIITPGKNRVEDKLAQRLINEGGEIVEYTGQDKVQDSGKESIPESEEHKSSFSKKKKKRYGGND